MSTCLYRFYDMHDTLLYVGISSDPAQRFRGHRHSKDWWEMVTRIEIERFETRREALAAEALAIHDEDPAYNIARPNPQRVAGVQVLIGKCTHCARSYVDELYPDCEPMTECHSCNELMWESHVAGSQWGIAYTRREYGLVGHTPLVQD